MSKTYSAGIVTAYGAAKRAGYQGTYEDFCRQQAGYAGNAAAVEAAKTAAQTAANTATTKAGEATTAATAAQTAKTQTEAAASQALTDIGTARSGAISAVQTEGATQTANATAQAQAAATSATTASTKASEASASATTATTKATEAAASATSAANAASAAQGVLESIPSDYSQMSADVTQLKADLDDSNERLVYKADKIFGGSISTEHITAEGGKAWLQGSGAKVATSNRATVGPIIYTPDMTSINASSGYLLYPYGNNDGAGHALTPLLTTFKTEFDVSSYEYKYIYAVLCRQDSADISSDLTDAFFVSKYSEALQLATKADVAHINNEIIKIKKLDDIVDAENTKMWFSNQDTVLIGNVEAFMFEVVSGVKYTFDCETAFDRKVIAYNTAVKPKSGTQMVGKTFLTKNEFVSPYTGWAVLYVNSSLNDAIKDTFTVRSCAPLFGGKAVINVFDYGAIGKGGNYTSEIANAISACPENGIVYFPSGLYVVNNVQLKTNMTIIGDDRRSIIQLASGVADGNNCCTVNDVHDVSIKNLAFDGNRLNNASGGDSRDTGFNGIHIRNSYNIVIDNVWSYNNGYHGCIITRSHNIDIRNSKFWDNGFRPIHGHDTVHGINVESNECWNNGLGFDEGSGLEESGYDAVFFFDDIKDLSIRGNYIHDVNTLAGIQLGGNVLGTGNISENIVVADNIVSTKGTAVGISVLGRGISNVSIVGNVIDGCTEGIYFYDTSETADDANRDIVVSSNIIRNTADIGIRFLNFYSNVIITGNTIVDGATTGVNLVGQHDILIQNNVIEDYKNGIVVGASQNVNIANNIIRAVKTESPMSASVLAFDTSSKVYVLYNFCSHSIRNLAVDGITLP